tara:strand:+ start:381 stop:605 length:225 start_codon:yes stop_codon:yes gene_type:complete
MTSKEPICAGVFTIREPKELKINNSAEYRIEAYKSRTLRPAIKMLTPLIRIIQERIDKKIIRSSLDIEKLGAKM